MTMQRRQFLRYMGMSAAGFVAYPFVTTAGQRGQRAVASSTFQADVEIELSMAVTEVAIFSGPKTKVWKVFGKVLKGGASVLQNHEGSYLAPTLRLQQGQKVRITLSNNLPAHSILHWHGLHVPAEMDGNPRDEIATGERLVYEFEVRNRAGSYWYHAHTHGKTARQVYSGLAGMLLVSDAEEQALDLPRGEFDLPVVLQDRRFDAQNQLDYRSTMMQQMQGFLGNKLLINGQPDFVLSVATAAYRLRFLNGSNSRIYKLAWDDGSPMHVIGVDGGFLAQPVSLPYVMLAPGQRREIWVDFSAKPLNTELKLRSLPFDAGMMNEHMGGRMGGMGMMGGHMGMQQALPLGEEYPVMSVRVTKKITSTQHLPKQLSTINMLRAADAANAGQPRRFTLSMQHMSALLNGRSYAMDDVRDDEVMPLNTLQLIEFDNTGAGGMGMGMQMSMPHPMHMHGEQFQIVKRAITAESKESHATVVDGLVDQGWHDTVLVMPGERVTVLKPFNDYPGVFMVHCHNLEHEDLGMMREILVR